TFLLQHLNPKQKQEFIKLLFSLPNSNSLLKEFKELFEEFKDYEALLVVLKHNISFHLQFINNNLTLIKEWLHSKEFKEKYLDTKHPYPSLLNPLKLDYESVDAELAWDMNVPLPDLYQFIFVLIHGAGTTSMTHFLRLCGVSLNRHWGNADFQYKQSYQMLLNNKNNYNAIIVSGSNFDGRRDKMIALCDKSCPVLCVVRDPICHFLPLINHVSGGLSKVVLKEFTLDTPMEDLFDFEVLRRKDRTTLKEQLTYYSDKDKDKEGACYLNHFLKQATKVICIDMEQILPHNAFKTLNHLAKELNFCPPQNSVLFEKYINSNGLWIGNALFYRIFKYKNIKIELSKERQNDENFIECIRNFTQNEFIIHKNKARVYIAKKDFEILKEDKELFEKITNYLKEYFVKCEEKFQEDSKKIYKEQDVLDCLRQNSILALKFKEKIDTQYSFVKKHYPEIFKSWSYYNEFEKICEEFDKH
ncbi:DUF2972 domain-containing protein, partial [Campylobacter cuniculorum]